MYTVSYRELNSLTFVFLESQIIIFIIFKPLASLDFCSANTCFVSVLSVTAH